jgi:hypothetical protein
VAQLYIKPDRLSIVLVGNSRAFLPQLKSVGFTDFEIIPIERLDLMSATLQREPARVWTEPAGAPQPARPRTAFMPEQANPGPSTRSDPAAMELLRKVIDARGGLMALKGVRTVIAEADTELQMQQGSLSSRTKTYISYPSKVRVDAEVNGAETTQVYNAGTAWVKSPAGVQDAPLAMIADMAASVRRDTIPLLIGAAEGRLTVRLLPDQQGRDAKPARVLEVSGEGLDRVRLLVDERMLITGLTYTRADPTGRSLLSEEVFSDYRQVSGLQVPFEARLLLNGQPVLRRTLTNVVINEPLADSLFARPQ